MRFVILLGMIFIGCCINPEYTDNLDKTVSIFISAVLSIVIIMDLLEWVKAFK